ncbi:MAG: hypothetical protein FWF78_05890, partial [Defluviitaleaceae bacterium]|nr:hypothetical protein [Defluviitaleaceae bacterium]
GEVSAGGTTTASMPNGLVEDDEIDDFEIAPAALGRLTIEALSYTEFGVDVGSDFLVSSDTQSLSEEHLAAFLSMGDGSEFTLTPHSSNRFLLQFEDDMAVNSIVNFVYQPPGFSALSHAFQTADVFRITNTSPAENTFNVPNTAGIEITFNQSLQGGLASFEQAFSIEPAVEGQFFQRENTYIFAPVAMGFNRTHTVTIREGLVGESGEVLATDHVFSFATTWGTVASPAFSLSNTHETFLPWQDIFVAMRINRDFRHRDFILRLYELPDYDSFINFEGVDSGTFLEENALELYSTGEDWHSFHYLFLGRTLPEGYYVAQIRGDAVHPDIVLHKFIQVSPISVYSLSVDGEALFWVHDASTGQAAHGARVAIGGETVATAGADGIAMAATNSDSRATVTIHYGDYLPFVYTKPTFGSRELLANERFLFYMYTDRPTYRPDDTVDVFGVIRPRYGQARSQDDVFTLRIGNMFQMPIIPDSFDSFAVRIPVTAMFGYTNISVYVNNERLMSSWVNFLDYSNISFVISGELDRRVHELGDNALAKIRLATFAGRPVEGVMLRSHGNPYLVTNEYGIASGEIPLTEINISRRSWHPNWSSFWYVPVDGGQSGISLPYIMVPRDTMLESRLDGDTMTITTSSIDIQMLEEATRGAQPWSYIISDIFRGNAVDIDFEIQITRNVTTRTIRSQRYDHINRRMVTTYNFNTTSELYRVIEGTTENGQAIVTGLPVSDDRFVSYQMVIHFSDSRGRDAISWVNRSWGDFYMQESSIRHFFFPFAYNNRFRVGQTMDVTILESPHEWWWEGSETIPLTEGNILAVLVRDGIIEAAAGDVSGVQLTFSEAGVSNAILFGAYFDGQHIFPVTNQVSVRHDYNERRMAIELNFCQEEYRPGDDVTIGIRTDRPAQVLISVVDESAIQSPWHRANFLSRLYSSSMVWSWMLNFHQFASHIQHDFGGGFGGGAEGGGGENGGDSLRFRDFFVDNPVFEKVITTDADTTLTFTLPDQITSWRVTALGITECGFVGESVVNIISSLDFYVEILYTNEYIVGDDIAALVRSFGQDMGEVNFTFSILSGDSVIFTDSQTVQHQAVFNAGKLPAGEYRMQVTATAGDYSDALERPFTVAEYALIIQNNISGEISEESTLDPTMFNMRSFPVRLTLTNANIRPLTRILNDAVGRRSSRTDHIAAAAFRDYFFMGEMDSHAVRTLVHGSHSGIPELTYETPDLVHTARFAASFPEFVDPILVREFALSQLDANGYGVMRTHLSVALFALAAVGEPVLLQVHQEIEQLTAFDSINVLYLAAALVAMGDDTAAAELFSQYIETQHSGQRMRELTAALAFYINTTLNPQAAWEYARHNSQNRYVSDVPERINFVRRAVSLGDTVSEFEYTLHGETHHRVLNNFERLHLHLSHEQFQDLNITHISGETSFHLSFQSYNSDNWNPDNNRIRINRTITPADNGLYRVTLNITLPPDARGSFTIYDRLPSNMRFVPSRHFLRTRPWYSVSHMGRQLVQLNIHAGHHTVTPLARTIYYYAITLYDADMADGTTYITNQHIWGSTR